MHRRIALVTVALACLSAGCASSRSTATRTSLNALHYVDDPPPTTTTTLPNREPSWPCKDTDPTPSLAPKLAVPLQGQMGPGTFMYAIKKRGYLKVGVDQNTLVFGYRRSDGAVVGFDVNLLRDVAQAIFGAPDKIRFLSVTSAQRIPAVANGTVDIVASLLSITCKRWQQVDFTNEYFGTYQDVMVRSDSSINSVADLNGKTVCATKGSTSIVNIQRKAPGAKLYPVDFRTDCLVALEEGVVDAISSDDTILYGFHAQDPNTKLLDAELEQERYGMAISMKHPEFVRFVNAVLQQSKWPGYERAALVQHNIPVAPLPAPEYRS